MRLSLNFKGVQKVSLLIHCPWGEMFRVNQNLMLTKHHCSALSQLFTIQHVVVTMQNSSCCLEKLTVIFFPMIVLYQGLSKSYNLLYTGVWHWRPCLVSLFFSSDFLIFSPKISYFKNLLIFQTLQSPISNFSNVFQCFQLFKTF